MGVSEAFLVKQCWGRLVKAAQSGSCHKNFSGYQMFSLRFLLFVTFAENLITTLWKIPD